MEGMDEHVAPETIRPELERLSSALADAQRYLLDLIRVSRSLHLLRTVSDELLNYDGDFAPIRRVVQHLGARGQEALRNNIDAALQRAGITR